jgi:hypothetical protein
MSALALTTTVHGGEPRVDSRQIADYLGAAHKAFRETMREGQDS